MKVVGGVGLGGGGGTPLISSRWQMPLKALLISES